MKVSIDPQESTFEQAPKMSARTWQRNSLLFLWVVPVVAWIAYSLLIKDRAPRLPPPLPIWRDPVTVEAKGCDFRWSFRYPGADGRLGTADDVQSDRLLVLPPGVDVTLLLTSDDYIYTLTLEPYGLREIAVPDLVYQLQFHTARVEEFDLMVDPLCGFRFYHDEVMGHVSITPRTDYSTWFGTVDPSDERS
jgi:cytochrome c oxidase subunit 2